MVCRILAGITQRETAAYGQQFLENEATCPCTFPTQVQKQATSNKEQCRKKN
jgi:hypothetical protein